MISKQKFLYAGSFVLAIVFTVTQGCDSSTSKLYTPSKFENPKTYFSTMTDLKIEVAYETDAAPYVGAGLAGGNLWDFTRANLNALFQGRPSIITLDVPTTLSEMQNIPAQNKGTFTEEEILGLAATHRLQSCTEKKGDFLVLFLNGSLNDGTGGDSKVIGINPPGTAVIAIFKTLVKSTGTSSDQKNYLEQAAIVHLLGHALGLVNNGVRMVNAHENSSSRIHCTRTSCLMNDNDQAANLLPFVVAYILPNFMASIPPVPFDSECLNDTRSYAP